MTAWRVISKPVVAEQVSGHCNSVYRTITRSEYLERGLVVLEHYDTGSLPQMRRIGQNECPMAPRWIHNEPRGFADTALFGGRDEFRLL
jgi:hypothetical protein